MARDRRRNCFSELGCVTCHRSDTQGRGPNLVGLYGKPVQLEDGRIVTADENYIRESILEPGAKIVKGFKPIMPVFQGLMSEEQLNALVAYVKSLTQSQSGNPQRPARQRLRKVATCGSSVGRRLATVQTKTWLSR